ncbi:MAG: hypothetical protein COT71_00575 [Candidatus Andersenbacteria bacterium CG10_big_fil_rev_8_21_14_0_10_54_11]|uniref:Uncharacterized protein n=1 Tax=Candidatus Andersenbacteria bacterium CG10_big_fil_rev_8_21_14_0_10_54_11 TaxID=1974485 RepID=A0A2M6X0C6_9BACT|nr:MAG: hypothetical protein COT71_00575 [Candidatus Andersenbacteria bacterium CG10_big_fil_rev_8_21_14_0_10_54_11]
MKRFDSEVNELIDTLLYGADLLLDSCFLFEQSILLGLKLFFGEHTTVFVLGGNVGVEQAVQLLQAGIVVFLMIAKNSIPVSFFQFFLLA